MTRAIYQTQRWIAGQTPEAMAAAIAGYFPALDRGVLTRALAVTRADRRRPASDRRSVVQALQGRLRALKKTIQQAGRRPGKGTQPGRSFIPLPVLD